MQGAGILTVPDQFQYMWQSLKVNLGKNKETTNKGGKIPIKIHDPILWADMLTYKQWFLGIQMTT